MPGTPLDCPHGGSIAITVALPDGPPTTTCPACASAAVERALNAGVDESTITITAAPAGGGCNHEAEHRAAWSHWADQRIPLIDPEISGRTS